MVDFCLGKSNNLSMALGGGMVHGGREGKMEVIPWKMMFLKEHG